MKLKKATFFSNISVPDFIQNYLPIYQGLKYEIGYLSHAKNEYSAQIDKDILHISFANLDFGEEGKNKNLQPKNATTNMQSNIWVSFQNKVIMEGILLELTQHSFIYARLFNVYMSLYFNNLLVFLLFCWYSTFVQLISL